MAVRSDSTVWTWGTTPTASWAMHPLYTTTVIHSWLY
ncbi:hypothetical protein ACN28S_33660 [Cystobacter fuscus]